jgi:hypothetical protein
VGALANEEVGKYVNEYYCSAFQKVATFRIVGGQKQGGNVAAYFCAPDGRVLNIVAGPVDAATFLDEAKWTVDTAKKAIEDSKGDGAKFKAILRKAHAEKLKNDHGLVVEPVTFDPPAKQEDGGALSYKDPSGRPLAPELPPPPIDGPDVTIRAKQEKEANAPMAAGLMDRAGRRWVLGTQGRAHQLLAAHSLQKIETIYATVFENILGEKVSTKPVEIVDPFPWVRAKELAK